MSGRRPDPEEVIREWLAGSVPDRAPVSLRAAVEAATSRPAGHAQPWPRGGWRSVQFAGRAAAAAAILAIACTGAYFYGNFRSNAPATTSAASASATATAAIAASPSPTTPPLRPVVTQLPGSNWSLVSGALPGLVKPTWSQYQKTVFALASGFVAFVPSAGAGASAQPGGPTSWETRVYQSVDGIAWVQRSSLPGATDTVTAVAQSGDTIVAVGSTGDTPNTAAATWTTTDLATWQAIELPTPNPPDTYSDASGVAAGPAGFVTSGYVGTSTRFWISADGLSWTSIAPSGLPTAGPIDALYGVSDGWVIRGFLSDRAAMWHSTDGATWTRSWTGPAPQGLEFYALGPILKAAGGGYLSFGVAGMGPGGPAATPYDRLIWTSKNFTNWAISARVPAPGWVSDYGGGPGGYVAAGVLAPGDQMVLPAGSVAVWTSRDGRAWKAISGLESIGSSQVLAVVGDGAHVVVVCVDQAGKLQLVVGGGAS